MTIFMMFFMMFLVGCIVLVVGALTCLRAVFWSFIKVIAKARRIILGKDE